MSGFEGHARDFSEYNHMSTEDLEAILQADFELPDDQESDMEKVLYITEVIAQRREGEPTGRYANTDEAWDSFVENYCPAPEREVFRRKKDTGTKKSRNGKRLLVRAASIAAAVVLTAAATTVTASAFGFDFWAWLTEWTRGIFSIQDLNPAPNGDSEIPEQLMELREAMEEYGFPGGLLPTYLPDGYEMAELKCDATSGYVHLNEFLTNSGNDVIILDYRMHLDDQTAFEVQKDGDNPEAYERGEVTHYIMTNYETYYATWTTDHVVCIISGFASYDELIRVIDSIYGG